MATPTPSKALIVPAVVTTHRLRSASASVRHSRHPPIPICGYGPRCCHLMAKLRLFRICGKMQAGCADSDTFVFLGTLCKGNFHRGSESKSQNKRRSASPSQQSDSGVEKREASTELPGGIKGGGAGHKKIKYKDFLYIVLKTQK